MAQTRQPTKTPTSVRLSAIGKRLLDRLSKRMGISKAAVLELAIRQMAEREGVK